MEYSNRIRKFSNKAGRKSTVTVKPKDTNTDIELLRNAITATMLALDAKLLEEVLNNASCNEVGTGIEGAFDVSDSGTTALIVILTQTHIVCANLGDSRAILQRRGGNNTTIR